MKIKVVVGFLFSFHSTFAFRPIPSMSPIGSMSSGSISSMLSLSPKNQVLLASRRQQHYGWKIIQNSIASEFISNSFCNGRSLMFATHHPMEDGSIDNDENDLENLNEEIEGYELNNRMEINGKNHGEDNFADSYIVEDTDNEDDMDDVITQKLRSASANANILANAINPVKEHDKMTRDNREEAERRLNFDTFCETIKPQQTNQEAMKEQEEIISDSNINDVDAAVTSLGNSNNITTQDLTKLANYSTTLYSYLLSQIDPNFDPLQSSDEEYLESQFQELLSRKGEELARLGPGINSPPPDITSSNGRMEYEEYHMEKTVEDAVAEKETELQKIIDEAESIANNDRKSSSPDGSVGSPISVNSPNLQGWDKEKLVSASRIQSEINSLHLDDCSSVLLSNLRFYEAFSARDIDLMSEVWWHNSGVICIHPSHDAVVGSGAVLRSFEEMFVNGLKGGGGNGGLQPGKGQKGMVPKSGGYLTPTNIRGFTVRGNTASLVCDEEVYSHDDTIDTKMSRGILRNKLLSTNIFRKIGGTTWKMVHRHASWHPETYAALEAKKAMPGLYTADGNGDNADGGGTNKSADREGTSREVKLAQKSLNQWAKRTKPGLSLRKLNGEGTSLRKPNMLDIPSSLDGLDSNAVWGIPEKDEESSKGKSQDVDGIIKRVINLSDLLGGGDGSEGSSTSSSSSSSSDGIADALADLLSGSSDSDKTYLSGSGTPGDPIVSRRIIRIGPDGIDDLMNKKKDIPRRNDDVMNMDKVRDAIIDDDDDENEESVYGDDASVEDDNGTEIQYVDLRGKSQEEQKQVLSQVIEDVTYNSENKRRKTKGSSTTTASSPATLTTPTTPTQSSASNNQDIRQECIATLRKLSEQGLLSPKQKRALLTDIITSSARGEWSMVEIAYELLCAGENDERVEKDEGNCDGEHAPGMEDFMEQCRVFAASSLGEEDDR